MCQNSTGKQREDIIEATACKWEMNRKKALNGAQAKAMLTQMKELSKQRLKQGRKERKTKKSSTDPCRLRRFQKMA